MTARGEGRARACMIVANRDVCQNGAIAALIAWIDRPAMRFAEARRRRRAAARVERHDDRFGFGRRFVVRELRIEHFDRRLRRIASFRIALFDALRRARRAAQRNARSRTRYRCEPPLRRTARAAPTVRNVASTIARSPPIASASAQRSRCSYSASLRSAAYRPASTPSACAHRGARFANRLRSTSERIRTPGRRCTSRSAIHDLPEPETPHISTNAGRRANARSRAKSTCAWNRRNRSASSARLRLQRRHLRPHHRSIDEIEAEQRTAAIVAGLLEIAVEERIREIAAIANFAVHHQERRVADHVDPAQRLAELDAVERMNAVVEPHEVRQVQIAVTLAHEAVAAALFDRWREFGMSRVAPCFEFVDLFGPQSTRTATGAPAGSSRRPDRAPRRRCRTSRRPLRAAASSCTARACRRTRRALQSSGSLPRAAGRVACRSETAAYEPRTRSARRRRRNAPRRRSSVIGTTSTYNDSAKRRLRRTSSSQIAAPQRQRREIEESEVDGLLDLVGELAGEEHPRDVRLHQLDAVAVMQVGIGTHQVPE